MPEAMCGWHYDEYRCDPTLVPRRQWVLVHGERQVGREATGSSNRPARFPAWLSPAAAGQPRDQLGLSISLGELEKSRFAALSSNFHADADAAERCPINPPRHFRFQQPLVITRACRAPPLGVPRTTQQPHSSP